MQFERVAGAALLLLTAALFAESRWAERAPPPPAPLAALAAADGLRAKAIDDAVRGVERAKLRDEWRALGTPEGQRMAALYEQLVAEDAKLVPRSAAEVAALDSAARAAYWLSRLRDARAWPVWSAETGWPKDDPAVAIGGIGWPAVPLLVAHLDDPRPTRTRDQTSGRLWTYGDYCRLLLNSAAGVQLGDRTAAEAWWREAEKQGEAEHFRRVLERDESPFQTMVASDNLLRIDAARFLPLIVAVVKKDRARHLELLEHVAPHLAGHEAELLATSDLDALAPVARALREGARSEKGAERILAVLASWNAATATDAARAELGWAAAFVARSRPVTPALVDRYLALLASPEPAVRKAAFESAWRLPDARVAARLADLLHDPSAVGRVRACDAAAWCLAFLIHADAFDLHAPLEKRDAAIRALEARFSEQRARLDWAKLARDVDVAVRAEH